MKASLLFLDFSSWIFEFKIQSFIVEYKIQFILIRVCLLGESNYHFLEVSIIFSYLAILSLDGLWSNSDYHKLRT